jgi:phage terminase large subunit
MIWPPDYVKVFALRQYRAIEIAKKPERIFQARAYYSTRPLEFIEDWGMLHEPRNAGTNVSTILPFVMFPRQRDLIRFIHACVTDEESGLVEKSRDMGATWGACGYSVWAWLFWPGVSIGWGSRVSVLVDKIGIPSSIFQKMRIFVRGLPAFFLPRGFSDTDHLGFMRFINPETDASISGEIGDNIGRGGRTRFFFKDESAHYERPEVVEAALESNTRVQIDISSVCGLGNVFHQKREMGVEWDPDKKDYPKHRTRVFVMDWRDHPAKTQEWYDLGRRDYLQRGLLHLWAQEVDRNYAAAVQGVIIPNEWVKSAIDAHKRVEGLTDEGGWCAGLDVADEGGDLNALAKRKGVVLKWVEEWGDRDPGVVARRAIDKCRSHGRIDLEYDCIGVGAGVKAEANRLADEKIMPREIRLVPWNAGAKVLNPDDNIIPGDKQSPTNADFYENLSAQAAWELRLRFERTHRAVTEPHHFTWDPDELISIDSSTIPLGALRQLEKELSQPTAGLSSRLRTMVNKKPDGTRSPNMFDAVKMCYFPVPVKGVVRVPSGVIERIAAGRR